MEVILDKIVRQKVEEKEEETKQSFFIDHNESLWKSPKKYQRQNVPDIIINYSVATVCRVSVQKLTAFLYNTNE